MPNRSRHAESVVYLTVYFLLPNGEEDLTEDVEIEVSGNVQPFVRGNRRGDPGDWEPDEGGEVEDLSFSLDGKEISEAHFLALGGDLDDAREAVAGSAESREQAAWDDWNDARRDDHCIGDD